MRTIFMGSDAIALPMLEVLADKGSKLCVVSRPDRPAGRGQKMTPNAVSAWALNKNIELLRPQRPDAEFLAQLKKFDPEIIFVMAYGRMLKQELLDLPPLGTWNLHGSLLPQLRGASPVETAIAEGHQHTAVVLMRMVLKLDAGPVGPIMSLKIEKDMTSHQLRLAMAASAAVLIQRNWESLASGSVVTTAQQELAATYCRLLTKEDIWLNPADAAEALVNRVRAFGENIGACLILKGERVKILLACVAEGIGAPGQVLLADKRLVVATGRGALEILSLQREGGKVLPAAEFLRGHPVAVGEVFVGRPLRPLVSPTPFPRNF